MKNILLFVFAYFVLSISAQANCAHCSHNQFGDAYCSSSPLSCACDCQAINAPSYHSCDLGGGCDSLGCVWYCNGPASAAKSKGDGPRLVQAAQTTKDGLTEEQVAAEELASHPWIGDSKAADNISSYSKSMSVVFAHAQDLIKIKHRTNGSGWMSTTKDNPSDSNGWVNYELISRDNGVDEIRVVYEKSGNKERLVLTPSKKWALYRIEPNADHADHETVLGRGEIATNF